MSKDDSLMNLRLDEYPNDPQRWGGESQPNEPTTVLPLLLAAFGNVLILTHLAWKWDSRRYWR